MLLTTEVVDFFTWLGTGVEPGLEVGLLVFFVIESVILRSCPKGAVGIPVQSCNCILGQTHRRVVEFKVGKAEGVGPYQAIFQTNPEVLAVVQYRTGFIVLETDLVQVVENHTFIGEARKPPSVGSKPVIAFLVGEQITYEVVAHSVFGRKGRGFGEILELLVVE